MQAEMMEASVAPPLTRACLARKAIYKRMYRYAYIFVYTTIVSPSEAGHNNRRKTLIQINVHFSILMFEKLVFCKYNLVFVGLFCVIIVNFLCSYEIQCEKTYI